MHWRRRHPGRKVPHVWPADLLGAAAVCLATLDGSEGEREQTIRDALDGAWLVSHGPPEARFVFREPGHFLRHAEAGARARRSRERLRPTLETREMGPEVTPCSSHELAAFAAFAVEALNASAKEL
jgi:hypothetical protein